MRHETRALLDVLLEPGHLGAVEPRIERLVRRRLGREQKMPADLAYGLAGRLPRRQIIAQIDRLQTRIFRPMGCKPAVRGASLAILLLGAILGGDELRLERQRTLVPRCNKRGRDHGVEMLDLAIGALALRAALARQLLRAEVLGAVQRDQHMAAQPLERGEPAAGLERGKRSVEHREQRFGRHGIEHRADVVVGRDPLHPEQRLAVRRAAPALQRRLKGQKRRTLHEKHGERCHADVRHLIDGVLAPPAVRQGRTQGFETRDERFESHCELESARLHQVDDSFRRTRPPCRPSATNLPTQRCMA